MEGIPIVWRRCGSGSWATREVDKREGTTVESPAITGVIVDVSRTHKTYVKIENNSCYHGGIGVNGGRVRDPMKVPMKTLVDGSSSSLCFINPLT